MIEALTQLREIMESLTEPWKTTAIYSLQSEAFDLDMLRILTTDKYKENSIVEEITSIFVIMTSVEDTEFICRVAGKGLIHVLSNCFATSNSKILENILLVFGNVVHRNNEYRDLYNDKKLLRTITKALVAWKSFQTKDVGVYLAYIYLLQNYLTVEPHLGFKETKYYLSIIIDLYVNLNETYTRFLEHDILKFIFSSLAVAEHYNIDYMTTKDYWNFFIIRLADNLNNIDLEVVALSVKILLILVCSEDTDKFEVLLNARIFEHLYNLFSDAYHSIISDLLLLVERLMQFSGKFVDSFIEHQVIIKIMTEFEKAKRNGEPIAEYLITLCSLFSNEHNTTLVGYLLKNLDLIDIIIDAIKHCEGYEDHELIHDIMVHIVAAGSAFYSDTFKDNIVLDYIADNEQVRIALIDILHNEDYRVVGLYKNFLEKHFKFD